MELSHYEKLKDQGLVDAAARVFEARVPPGLSPVDCVSHSALFDRIYRETWEPATHGRDEGENIASRNTILQVLRTYYEGENIYYIHPDLADELLVTSVADVPTEFVELPYEGIHIQVPAGVPLRAHNIRSGEHQVTGMYVQIADGQLLVLVIGAPNGKDLNQDALFTFALGLEKPTVAACVDSETSWQVERLQAHYPDHPIFVMQAAHAIREYVTFTVNVLLYLNSLHPDIIEQYPEQWRALRKKILAAKSAGKRKELERRAGRVRKMPVHMVGSQFNVVRLETKERSVAEPREPPGRKLNKRFMVEAHWRNQPCGPGRKQRKLILIPRHVKGPDMAEFVRHKYEVRK